MYLNLKDKQIAELKRRNERLREENRCLMEQLEMYEGMKMSLAYLENTKDIYNKLIEHIKLEKDKYIELNRELAIEVQKLRIKNK